MLDSTFNTCADRPFRIHAGSPADLRRFLPVGIATTEWVASRRLCQSGKTLPEWRKIPAALWSDRPHGWGRTLEGCRPGGLPRTAFRRFLAALRAAGTNADGRICPRTILLWF